MHLSIATILAVFPLLVLSTPTTQKPRLTIPLTKRTNVYRRDGSVDIEALKLQLARSTAKFLQGFDNYERNTGQRHPLSPDIKDFKRNLAHEPLSDEGILWTGTVSVGSPPADFTVDIDTGSSDLFIPSQSCDSTCSGDNIYNPSASHTSTDTGKSFNLTYGSGFAAVEEFTDTITIAGLTVATQSIGAATHLSSGFQPSNFPADGIMGMAFQSLSAFNAPPVFQSLVAAGQTDSSLFALSLTSAGGELTLGGLNQDLYIGGVDYLPVDGNGYWKVTFDSLAINVKEVIGNVPCVIDSGTTLIVGRSDDVATFYQQIPGAQLAPDQGDGFYSYPCNFSSTVSFLSGSLNFPFSLNLGQIDEENCLGNIVASTQFNFWILGDAFMTNYYTIFDVGNQQLALATLP